jgi:hypothetical protein
MATPKALAAGQSGPESNNLTPKSETPALDTHSQNEENPTAPRALAVSPAPSQAAPPRASVAERAQDDAYRQVTVQDLALALSRSDALLARCQAMAEVANFDQLGPINAAARLMNAQAQVAKALAQAAQVERRSRTIIETVQRPNPENAGLNSIFSQGENSSPEQRKKIRDALERALLQFLQEQKQDRERAEGLAIGSSI